MDGITWISSRVRRSIFDTQGNDDDAPMCFMAKSSNASLRSLSFHSSDDDLLTDELEDLKPSYTKLTSITKKQLKTLDKAIGFAS